MIGDNSYVFGNLVMVVIIMKVWRKSNEVCIYIGRNNFGGCGEGRFGVRLRVVRGMGERAAVRSLRMESLSG